MRRRESISCPFSSSRDTITNSYAPPRSRHSSGFVGATSAISCVVTYADDLTPISTSAPLGSKPMMVPVVVSPRVNVGISFIVDARSSYEKSAAFSSPAPQPSSGSYDQPP